MSSKPKNNSKAPQKDKCQTPPYALVPLIPYLLRFKGTIWEPAEGEGLLVNWLTAALDEPIFGSDISTGHDFFSYAPNNYDVIVTNPPFSLKFPWLKRCYELGKPFALLMPADALFAKTAQKLFVEYGVDVILMTPRIDYKMPNVGWDGAAQMSTAWFTWHLVPEATRFHPVHILIANVAEEKKAFKQILKENPNAY